MLPEAVRMLYVLKHALGKRVYVHCTAGINRATLTVVGYLTFVQVTRGTPCKPCPPDEPSSILMQAWPYSRPTHEPVFEAHNSSEQKVLIASLVT